MTTKKPRSKTAKVSRKTGAARVGPARKTSTRPAPRKKWSQRVTDTSDAMDLKSKIFTAGSPRAIAASIKRSAERSNRRKSPPYRSAISMLTFYINRGGKNISATQRRKLERAKVELRALFGKAAAPSRA